MLNILQNNIGTIVVAAIVAAAVILVLVKFIKDKKAGKSSCSCGCQGCPNADYCHRKDGCGRYGNKQDSQREQK
ncbi:MAG: FeoB-associated Cys-rich membrane protein [Clostridia bacterium]|nr:FeoB-associated Cys-rich membrane protein [Clostridia bacterium]